MIRLPVLELATKKYRKKVLAIFAVLVTVFVVAASLEPHGLSASVLGRTIQTTGYVKTLVGSTLTIGGGNGEDYLLHQTNYLAAWSTLLGEIKQWHFNTMRLAFSFSDCAVNPATSRHTCSVINYTKMDAVIDYLYSNEYRVILDLHNWCDMSQYCGSPSWHSNWQDVARHYKGDIRIIGFELFNEPSNNTGTWYPQTVKSRSDLAVQFASLTDEIRAIDPSRTMVWADPQYYLWCLTGSNPHSLAAGTYRENVIFDWHCWMSAPSKDTYAASVSFAQTKMNYAVVWQQSYPSSKQWMGEFGVEGVVSGYQFNATNQQALCVTEINICLQQGWGFCFWLWYEDCQFNTPDTYPAVLRASNY
jgi:hypothetical protein